MNPALLAITTSFLIVAGLPLGGPWKARGVESTPTPPHDTVWVAEPTGERARDHAAVAEAFERVEPGGTIAFAAGTYLVGSEGLVLRTPRVTLLGHPDGTTLLGCTVEERADPGMGYLEDDPEMGYFWDVCDGLILAAEAQRVSGLRFEGFSRALAIRDPSAEGEPPASAGSDGATAFTGGHIIEGNTFQDVVTFSIQLDADSAVTVRGNVFRNTHHAVAIGGRNVHVLDNDISAPDPGWIPDNYAGVAIGIRPSADGICRSMRVEGNRIEGHTEGIAVAIFPQDPAGAVCSAITIRDNEIVAGPVSWPADGERAGRLAVAPAIRLLNLQRAVGEGTKEWSERSMPAGGWPAEFSESRISEIRVELNRIVGAVGVAIEILYASDNHIVDNEIEVRPAVTSEELDGLQLGGNGGPGVWVEMGLVDEVNGTPVWVSPGSERNVVRNPQ